MHYLNRMLRFIIYGDDEFVNPYENETPWQVDGLEVMYVVNTGGSPNATDFPIINRLNSWGASVTYVSSAAQADAAVLAHTFSLAIMGYGTLDATIGPKFYNDVAFAGIPVFAYTAQGGLNLNLIGTATNLTASTYQRVVHTSSPILNEYQGGDEGNFNFWFNGAADNVLHVVGGPIGGRQLTGTGGGSYYTTAVIIEPNEPLSSYLNTSQSRMAWWGLDNEFATLTSPEGLDVAARFINWLVGYYDNPINYTPTYSAADVIAAPLEDIDLTGKKIALISANYDRNANWDRLVDFLVERGARVYTGPVGTWFGNMPNSSVWPLDLVIMTSISPNSTDAWTAAQTCSAYDIPIIAIGYNSDTAARLGLHNDTGQVFAATTTTTDTFTFFTAQTHDIGPFTRWPASSSLQFADAPMPVLSSGAANVGPEAVIFGTTAGYGSWAVNYWRRAGSSASPNAYAYGMAIMLPFCSTGDLRLLNSNGIQMFVDTITWCLDTTATGYKQTKNFWNYDSYSTLSGKTVLAFVNTAGNDDAREHFLAWLDSVGAVVTTMDETTTVVAAEAALATQNWDVVIMHQFYPGPSSPTIGDISAALAATKMPVLSMNGFAHYALGLTSVNTVNIESIARDWNVTDITHPITENFANTSARKGWTSINGSTTNYSRYFRNYITQGYFPLTFGPNPFAEDFAQSSSGQVLYTLEKSRPVVGHPSGYAKARRAMSILSYHVAASYYTDEVLEVFARTIEWLCGDIGTYTPYIPYAGEIAWAVEDKEVLYMHDPAGTTSEDDWIIERLELYGATVTKVINTTESDAAVAGTTFDLCIVGKGTYGVINTTMVLRLVTDPTYAMPTIFIGHEAQRVGFRNGTSGTSAVLAGNVTVTSELVYPTDSVGDIGFAYDITSTDSAFPVFDTNIAYPVRNLVRYTANNYTMLGVVETGDTLYSGYVAQARMIAAPLGHAFLNLTADGRNLIGHTVEWAMGLAETANALWTPVHVPPSVTIPDLSGKLIVVGNLLARGGTTNVVWRLVDILKLTGAEVHLLNNNVDTNASWTAYYPAYSGQFPDLYISMTENLGQGWQGFTLATFNDGIPILSLSDDDLSTANGGGNNYVIGLAQTGYNGDAGITIATTIDIDETAFGPLQYLGATSSLVIAAGGGDVLNDRPVTKTHADAIVYASVGGNPIVYGVPSQTAVGTDLARERAILSNRLYMGIQQLIANDTLTDAGYQMLYNGIEYLINDPYGLVDKGRVRYKPNLVGKKILVLSSNAGDGPIAGRSWKRSLENFGAIVTLGGVDGGDPNTATEIQDALDNDGYDLLVLAFYTPQSTTGFTGDAALAIHNTTVPVVGMTPGSLYAMGLMPSYAAGAVATTQQNLSVLDTATLDFMGIFSPGTFVGGTADTAYYPEQGYAVGFTTNQDAAVNAYAKVYASGASNGQDLAVLEVGHDMAGYSSAPAPSRRASLAHGANRPPVFSSGLVADLMWRVIDWTIGNVGATIPYNPNPFSSETAMQVSGLNVLYVRHTTPAGTDLPLLQRLSAWGANVVETNATNLATAYASQGTWHLAVIGGSVASATSLLFHNTAPYNTIPTITMDDTAGSNLQLHQSVVSTAAASASIYAKTITNPIVEPFNWGSTGQIFKASAGSASTSQTAHYGSTVLGLLGTDSGNAVLVSMNPGDLGSGADVGMALATNKRLWFGVQAISSSLTSNGYNLLARCVNWAVGYYDNPINYTPAHTWTAIDIPDLSGKMIALGGVAARHGTAARDGGSYELGDLLRAAGASIYHVYNHVDSDAPYTLRVDPLSVQPDLVIAMTESTGASAWSSFSPNLRGFPVIVMAGARHASFAGMQVSLTTAATSTAGQTTFTIDNDVIGPLKRWAGSGTLAITNSGSTFSTLNYVADVYPETVQFGSSSGAPFIVASNQQARPLYYDTANGYFGSGHTLYAGIGSPALLGTNGTPGTMNDNGRQLIFDCTEYMLDTTATGRQEITTAQGDLYVDMTGMTVLQVSNNTSNGYLYWKAYFEELGATVTTYSLQVNGDAAIAAAVASNTYDLIFWGFNHPPTTVGDAMVATTSPILVARPYAAHRAGLHDTLTAGAYVEPTVARNLQFKTGTAVTGDYGVNTTVGPDFNVVDKLAGTWAAGTMNYFDVGSPNPNGVVYASQVGTSDQYIYLDAGQPMVGHSTNNAPSRRAFTPHRSNISPQVLSFPARRALKKLIAWLIGAI